MIREPVQVITQDDLLAREAADDSKRYEVVEEQLLELEREMTYFHLLIIENLFLLLQPFARLHKLGRVHTDGVRYILIGQRKRVILARQPDLSFIRAGRIPPDYDLNGDIEGAPDLAVEVASPGQTNADLTGRISDYLSAGAAEAWLVYPARRAVLVYRADDVPPTLYHEGEVIESPLFPSLQIPVAALFVTDLEA